MLDGAAATGGRVHCPDSPDGGTPLGEVWSRAHGMARAMSGLVGRTGCIAGVLHSSEECLVVLFGAWLAGIRLASLPEPSRAMSPSEYSAQISTILGIVGADLLLARERPADLDLPGVRIDTFASVAGCASRASQGRRASGSDAGRLVQFTSGSTGSPKGVVLTMEAIGSNVASMADAYEFGSSDVSVSWLPLSHDMGLVGTCLLPFAAMSPQWGGAKAAWLLTPEGFVRDPLAWLRVVSTHGGSFTMVPNFALDVMVRRLDRASGLDLRSFRNMTVSAETVRGETLRRFTEAAGKFGFDERALSPAYGMAEITLGATTIRPGRHWSSLWLERSAFAEGEVVPVEGSGAGEEVVCLGEAFPHMGVRIAGDRSDRVGAIEVAGPSLAEELLGSASYECEDGFLMTSDLGFLADDELYFAGRSDDWIVVAGRNLDARDLEVRAGRHGLRPGNAVVVEDDRGTYAVVGEPAGELEPDEIREAAEALASAIRDDLASACGVAPSRIVLVERGSLPKTPSGKLQRRRVCLDLHGRSLAVVAEVETGYLRD